MAITCPNKKLKSWVDLVKVQGENNSYYLWNAYGGVVPERFYKKDIGKDRIVEDIKIPIFAFFLRIGMTPA